MIYRKVWPVPRPGDGQSPVTFLLGIASRDYYAPELLASQLGIARNKMVVEATHLNEQELMFDAQILFKGDKGSWACNMCTIAELTQILQEECNWSVMQPVLSALTNENIREFYYTGSSDNPESGLAFVQIINAGPIEYLLA